MRPKRTCDFDGCPDTDEEPCQRPHWARGYCTLHYGRLMRTGSVCLHRPSAEERFWAKVNKDGPLPKWAPFLGPCWVWNDRPLEYGELRLSKSLSPAAHRFSYELNVGPIPEGLQIDHLCRVPGCVRPDHLEAVPQKENILRGQGWHADQARKTHCKYGHPFDEVNTYWTKEGHRFCRACARRRQRERNRRLRLARQQTDL